jgi:hypothetical protein
MNYDFRLVDNKMKTRISDVSKTLFINKYILKFLKYILVVLKYDVVIQGSTFGFMSRWAYKVSVISDGLLSEYIYSNNYFKCKKFYSVFDIIPQKKLSKNIYEKIIIGTNYIQYKSMSVANYEYILRYLISKYPDYCYYPHPKEDAYKLKYIFGKNLIRNEKPFESYVLEDGLPSSLISIAVSTCIPSTLLMSNFKCDVKVCDISLNLFDGSTSDLVDLNLNSKGYNINMRNHLKYLQDKLRSYDHVLSTIKIS